MGKKLVRLICRDFIHVVQIDDEEVSAIVAALNGVLDRTWLYRLLLMPNLLTVGGCTLKANLLLSYTIEEDHSQDARAMMHEIMSHNKEAMKFLREQANRPEPGDEWKFGKRGEE